MGHLHCLWYWAIDNATDGSLAGFSPYIIAEVMGWLEHQAWWEGLQEEDPLKSCRMHSADFFCAVVRAGFIDYPGELFSPDGQLLLPGGETLGNFSPLPPGTSLHDWLDYCGDLVKKRLETKVAKRSKTDLLKADIARGKNLPRLEGKKSPSTVPYPTVPNSTVPQNEPPISPFEAKGDSQGGTKRKRRDNHQNLTGSLDPDKFIKGKYGHLVQR